MNIDLKCVKLTADVLEIQLYNAKCEKLQVYSASFQNFCFCCLFVIFLGFNRVVVFS